MLPNNIPKVGTKFVLNKSVNINERKAKHRAG
jgi:hypothetical protein